MAKKNKNVNPEPPKKSINEMTDSEFITYADYLSSPYYRAYVNARVRAEAGVQSERGAGYGGFVGAPVAPAVVPKNRRAKKRGFFLFLIMLIMLLTVAIAVTYFLNIATIDQYVSLYKIPDGKEIEVVDEETEEVTTEIVDAYVALTDAPVGMVKNFVSDLSLESEYYNNFIDGKLDDAEAMKKIAVFAVPVAAVVIIVCAVIGLIKALVALFSRKKSDGYYKKVRFGFLAILMFLCGLVLAVGGLYVSGLGFEGAIDFLTLKSEVMQAGYGLYAMIGLPILTFIFTCVAYKKIKK
ncbi:MAG: hypothetical protein IJ735_04820 [Clostridia bacterium]|nr:hypothetical protein [Clostridia bacterium]